MRIQVNSDKNIAVDAQLTQFIESETKRGLKGFISRLTRVEVFLSDVNSHKPGVRDKRCLIEARPARHRSLVASNRANTIEDATKGALTKLRSSLQTLFGRMSRARSLVAPRRSATKKQSLVKKKVGRSDRAARNRGKKS